MSYNTNVYLEQGGDRIVIQSGGEIKIETGGKITANGTQASAIVSLTDSTTGTANDTVQDVGAAFSQATLNNNFADLTAKINGILAALRGAGIIAG